MILSFVDTKQGINDKAIDIRDQNDEHVIISAYISKADVLVTGDKDFFDKDFGIEILTPANFIRLYGQKKIKRTAS